MSVKFFAFRIVSSILFVAALAVLAFGDTVRLKDGSIIKGRITNFSGGKFTVSIGEGHRKREMTFAVADIESIQFDSSPAAPANANISRRPEPDVVEEDPQIIKTSAPAKTTSRVIITGTAEQKTPSEARVPATRSGSSVKPIEVNIKVLADNTANGWTNSGWMVRKGQKIRITGDGRISLGRGISTSPSGSYDLEDDQKLLKSVPTGALIAVIGDDNNEFIYVGASREFVATRDGALFLGVNEGNLNDNSGSFEVKIEIAPDGAE